MVKYLIANGTVIFDVGIQLDEHVNISKISLYSNTKLIYSIVEDFKVETKHQLHIVFHGNPLFLFDIIKLNNIDKIIILDDKNNIVCFDDFKIEIPHNTQYDSTFFIKNFPYNKPKKVSAFTNVYNEDKMIKFWVDYYGKMFGHENLYVIDHGSNNNLKQKIDERVNIVRIPRGEYDNWNIVAFCSHFQRFLLTQYQWVIHTDCDEFLISKNNNDLISLMSDNMVGVNLTPAFGMEIIMDLNNESDLDYSKPISHQRKWMRQNWQFEKTCMTSIPTTWAVGFHKCYDKHIKNDDLWLMHLKYADLRPAVERNKSAWQTLTQSNLDKAFFALQNSQFYLSKNMEDVMPMAKHENDHSIEIPQWVRDINF